MDDPPKWESEFEAHFDRLLSQESIDRISKFHEQKTQDKSLLFNQIKWPNIGFLSHMKPMIDESHNDDVPMKYLEPCHDQSGLKLSEIQLELYSLLKSYKDLLYTNETTKNLDDIQTVYTLHVLQHMKSVRAKIVANNKLTERRGNKIEEDDDKIRDQGFSRARILILLPFRHSALRLGRCMTKLLGDKYNIRNYDKFVEEFGSGDGSDNSDKPIQTDSNTKPLDYYHTFRGNTDEAFRVGIKLTKKSLKFFSDFYDSDIIVASPLGLKTIVSANEDVIIYEVDSNSENGDKDFHINSRNTGQCDFLSSLEMVILDQAEIFLMQNWQHVIDILDCSNNIPKQKLGTDISRIRLWNLENWSKYYRQMIMFSNISVPLFHSFLQTYSLNYEGYLTLKHRVDKPQAKLLVISYKQEFVYYDSQNVSDAADARFNFFTTHVLKRLLSPHEENVCTAHDAHDGPPAANDHVLIFVNSYYDYVRLRNYFRREKLSFTQICEYTEDNKKAKARQLFYFGARQFLLYTERCHFYHRYRIKGVRRVIFYEPPQFPHFYSEIVKMMSTSLQGKKFVEGEIQFTVTTLFSNHDTLQLGAIVGYSNACRLIQNKKSIT